MYTYKINQSVFLAEKRKGFAGEKEKNKTEKNDNVERYWVLLHTFVSL